MGIINNLPSGNDSYTILVDDFSTSDTDYQHALFWGTWRGQHSAVRVEQSQISTTYMGTLSLGHATSQKQSSIIVNDGVFYKILISYDGSTRKVTYQVYNKSTNTIKGTQTHTNTADQNIITDGQLYIGGAVNSTGSGFQYFHGTMGRINIYPIYAESIEFLEHIREPDH